MWAGKQEDKWAGTRLGKSQANPARAMPDLPHHDIDQEMLSRPGAVQQPVLFSFRRCPYAIRARMALAVSATAYTLHEVALRNKPPELLAASPKGTVPVLVLPGGEVIDESLNIMLWALERHDPERWLGSGTDLHGMKTLIAHCDGAFKQALDAYKYPPKLPSNSPAAAPSEDLQTMARQQASVFIDALNQRLTHSACLCGAALSLADIAIAPFVRQFAGVQPAWFAQTPWTALRGWLDGITASALFTGIMQRQIQSN
jgi:glutathione S-transferase